MRFLLLTLLLLRVCSNFAKAQESATPITTGTANKHLVLELADGSRVIGIPYIDRLKMSTDYASLEIPLSLLSEIELSGTNPVVHARLSNGDILNGHLDAQNISIKTIFGVLPVL